MPDDIIDEYNGVLDSRYFVPHRALSAPTSIQTPNQIAEVTARLNAGVEGVDLALIYADIFEQVPKQHFKEIGRLAKLSNAKASIHGPIERGVSDLAGFEQGRYSEQQRKDTERKMKYFIDMAHEIDDKGNTPINFHINTNVPGEHWRKLNDYEVDEFRKQLPNIKDEDTREEIQQFIARGEINERLGIIDQETGQAQEIPFEVKHYPGREVYFTPKHRLEQLNQNQWDDDKLKIFEYQRQKALIDDRISKISLYDASPLIYGARHGAKLTDKEQAELEQYLGSIKILEAHKKELDTHIYSNLNELYNKLKYLPKEHKKEAEAFMKELDQDYKRYDNELTELQHKLIKGKEEEQLRTLNQIKQAQEQQYKELQLKLESIGHDERFPYPQRFLPTNDLAKEKTVETVSSAVYDSYKKYGDNTPIVTVENYWYNRTLGTARELKEVIQQSRDKFAAKLIKEEGKSKSEANSIAEKLIGVTWDVGHINMRRSGGYGEEKILEETKEIAPLVKQLHITDNFGFNDAHLPPGMGNAPINKEIEVLKKQGFKFEKGNIIVEAGGFPPQFNENPHGYALEYFNTPLYTYKAEPGWYKSWEGMGAYSLFMGDIMPDLHFRELYGAGFSNLPPELGGVRAADKGRFASAGQ